MKNINNLDKKVLTCQLLALFVQMPHLAWQDGSFVHNGLESPLGQCIEHPMDYEKHPGISIFLKYSQQDVLKPQYVGVFKNIEWAIIENVFYNIGKLKEKFTEPEVLDNYIKNICNREDITTWFTGSDIHAYIKHEEELPMYAELALNLK